MRLNTIPALPVFFMIFLLSLSISAQLGVVDRDAGVKPALMILGTYHMGTPGSNIVNSAFPDISTPERQRQIGALLDKLKKFKPNKIVLEIDAPDQEKTQKIYDDYLAGTYQLTKNETNQLGFRLAKELALKTVYCVDWSDDWDDPKISYEKYAKGDPEFTPFLKATYDRLKREVDAESAAIYSLPVAEQLLRLNQHDRAERAQKTYFDLMRIGRGNDHIGANYVAWWYRRNLVIYDKIVRLTESPQDRILVIYGAGHVKLLTQFARESGFYQVESPVKYLRK